MNEINKIFHYPSRDIIKERDLHSYRIQRLTKSLRDYLQFIKFEKNLVALIRERRKLKHIPQKKANIEMAVLNRIKILYKQTVQRFPEHVRVWDEYIQFCKIYKFGTEVSPILDRMIQFHADKPETWQKAVMWEHEETKNKERVKHFILGGLQRHPKSEILYFTFLKLKLLEGDKLKVEDSDGKDKLITQAELIYKDGKENISSIEFIVGMLEIVSRFEFARSLEALILSDMQSGYRDSELMWHTLAKRELSGRHLSAIQEEGHENAKSSSSSPVDPIKCIDLCVTIYETACDLVNTPQMWSYYLETMLELNGVPSIPEAIQEKSITGAFSLALSKGSVTEENLLKLIEFASEHMHLYSQEQLLTILENATKKYPKCVSLWEVQMRFHIEYQSVDEVAKVFRQALKQLSINDTYPLWELLLLFYKSDDKLSKKAKEIYREAIDLSLPQISNPLKPQFIEYLVQTEGIEAARKEYNKLCLCVPSSLEMHKQMARMEEMQQVANIPAWRKCHEMATQFFGQDTVDVWLEMIKFEKVNGDAKRVSQLYQRAMSSLSPCLVGTFITAYNLSVSKGV